MNDPWVIAYKNRTINRSYWRPPVSHYYIQHGNLIHTFDTVESAMQFIDTEDLLAQTTEEHKISLDV